MAKDILWTDAELKIAIEAYLYLLRLQQLKILFSTNSISLMLRDGPLQKRTDASIRYRMRNISYVLSKRNHPILEPYFPAANVGVHVGVRIDKILDNILAETNQLLSNTPISENIDNLNANQLRERALNKIDKIYEILSTDTDVAKIGHNNPPESIEEDFDEMLINEAIDDNLSIKAEIQTRSPRKEIVEEKSNRLIKFGLKALVWLGKRFTNFSDALLTSAGKTLGPLIACKLLGVIPLIISLIENLSKLFLK